MRRPETYGPDRGAASLKDRAHDDLSYIRRTMERASSFTAVPGWGNVAVGAVAFGAALVADGSWGEAAWARTWLAAAPVALVVALFAMARKARRVQLPLFGGAGARFWFGLVPPMAAGALITIPLYRRGLWDLLPPVWLVLYGAGVTTGGAHSVRLVPLMGLCFMIAGVIAFLTPRPDITMAAAFGGLHTVFGYVIARRYGG